MGNLRHWFNRAMETGELMLKTPPHKRKEHSEREYDTWLQGVLAAIGGGMIGTVLSGRGSSAIAKLGGGVAILALAYRAYDNYCGNTGRATIQERIQAHFNERKKARNDAKLAEMNIHSQALLMAIINLAKVEGELTEDRRAEIVEELTPLIDDQTMMCWMIDQLDAPFNIVELVELADGDMMIATEIYMITLTSVSTDNPQEMQYLNDLKVALGIDSGLASSIYNELPI